MNKQPNSRHCFICGVENISGVQVAFYETVSDSGSPEVLARFTARDAHQGYPGRMHGGIATGILDETIGRAINIGAGDADPQFWGVTAEINLRFHQPVPLGVELTARGRISKENRRLFEGTGELYLPDGTVAVSATGKYFKMTLDAISEVDTDDLGWRVYAD
ncbi:MAG: PaaI family thioesterase [Caldilineaceae bacterium]|nr:PaaI family thioesterase [Caldilineaceae bacterium]